jgi:ribosome-associated heat shock protein Hsp15
VWAVEVCVDKVRVDKWLWAARMYKTRSMSGDACAAEHVQINGEMAKASRSLFVGDTVHALTPGGSRELEVIALADKRGPAQLAQSLYIDHTPPPPPTLPGDPTFDRGSRKGRKGARPTKKERRKYTRERGS